MFNVLELGLVAPLRGKTLGNIYNCVLLKLAKIGFYATVFATAIYFHLSLIFAGKAGAYQSRAPYRTL